MTNYYYIHNEHGYLVTYDEMIEICRDEYDCDDPTNPLSWKEYFTKTRYVVLANKQGHIFLMLNIKKKVLHFSRRCVIM